MEKVWNNQLDMRIFISLNANEASITIGVTLQNNHTENKDD